MEPKKSNAIKYLLWGIPALLVFWAIYIFVCRSHIQPSMMAVRYTPRTNIRTADTDFTIGEVCYQGTKPFEVSLIFSKEQFTYTEDKPEMPEEGQVDVSHPNDMAITTYSSYKEYVKTEQGIKPSQGIMLSDMVFNSLPGSIIENAEPGDTVFICNVTKEMAFPTQRSRFSPLNGLWTVRFYYIVTDDGGIYITDEKSDLAKVTQPDFIDKYCTYVDSPEPKKTIRLWRRQSGSAQHYDGIGTSPVHAGIIRTPDDSVSYSLLVHAKYLSDEHQ